MVKNAPAVINKTEPYPNPEAKGGRNSNKQPPPPPPPQKNDPKSSSKQGQNQPPPQKNDPKSSSKQVPAPPPPQAARSSKPGASQKPGQPERTRSVEKIKTYVVDSPKQLVTSKNPKKEQQVELIGHQRHPPGQEVKIDEAYFKQFEKGAKKHPQPPPPQNNQKQGQNKGKISFGGLDAIEEVDSRNKKGGKRPQPGRGNLDQPPAKSKPVEVVQASSKTKQGKNYSTTVVYEIAEDYDDPRRFKKKPGEATVSGKQGPPQKQQAGRPPQPPPQQGQQKNKQQKGVQEDNTEPSPRQHPGVKVGRGERLIVGTEGKHRVPVIPEEPDWVHQAASKTNSRQTQPQTQAPSNSNQKQSSQQNNKAQISTSKKVDQQGSSKKISFAEPSPRQGAPPQKGAQVQPQQVKNKLEKPEKPANKAGPSSKPPPGPQRQEQQRPNNNNNSKQGQILSQGVAKPGVKKEESTPRDNINKNQHKKGVSLSTGDLPRSVAKAAPVPPPAPSGGMRRGGRKGAAPPPPDPEPEPESPRMFKSKFHSKFSRFPMLEERNQTEKRRGSYVSHNDDIQLARGIHAALRLGGLGSTHF